MEKDAHPIPNQRLRREREQRGWSQEDVAKKIGAPDDKTVRRWERGKVFPSSYYRQRLCTLYGKSAQELGLIPDTSSPVWSVPYPRNPFFTGREDVLRYLSATLTADKRVVVTQAISGLGGIGKSEIAVEYAYRYHDFYRVVLWARADTHEALVSDFVTIAGLLKLPEREARDQSLAVNAVKRWLESNTGWLLILDNADELKMAGDFLPQKGEGHILLTTRAQAKGSIAQGVELENLAPEEGMLFLLRRAKIITQDTPLDNVAPSDHVAAREIVRAMDGLPLALDQAGAYIEETGCSLSDFLGLYLTYRADLLQARGELTFGHPEPVATTWSLAFEKVQQASPAASDLLRLCAFLAPDGIPEEIITEGAPDLGSNLQSLVSNPHGLNTAVKALLKFSLVHRNAKTRTLSIHRLVQAILKDNMNEDTQCQWAERAVRAINHLFPPVEVTTWSRCQRYLPHVLVCAVFIEQKCLAFPEAARLLNQAGYYLVERAQYMEAEPLYQRALAIREQVLGPEHPDTMTSLNSLAWLYHRQGKYEQAEPLYQRALAIREQVLGPEHPDTAHSLNNLASLYERRGKYEQAEPLLQRALAIRERTLSPKHPDTAHSLYGLALLYYAQGKYKQAESFYQRALAIREQVLGPEHPHTAHSLDSLGVLYREQGKYEQAEPLYQRALAIRERVLGPEHPDTTTSLNNLALLYRRQGKYEQAEPLYQRALAIRERVLGPEHPYTATSLHHLALLYYAQGRYEEALPLYQRALIIRERVPGAQHPDTARSLNSLGVLYREQGKYEQAAPLLQRALEICERVLGPEHPNTAHSLYDLALLYCAQGKREEAAPLLQRALAIRERVLGLEHPDTARSLNGLAVFYREQGKYGEAAAQLQRALEICERVLGPEHPDVAQILNNLAVLYQVQDKYEQAEPLFRQALTIYEKALGTQHPNIAIGLKNYANLLRKMNRGIEATKLEGRAKCIGAKSLP